MTLRKFLKVLGPMSQLGTLTVFYPGNIDKGCIWVVWDSTEDSSGPAYELSTFREQDPLFIRVKNIPSKGVPKEWADFGINLDEEGWRVSNSDCSMIQKRLRDITKALKQSKPFRRK